MKKIGLLTLMFIIGFSATTTAQFGIERSIRKKFEKKGVEQAEKGAKKGLDAGEAKGMEQADKGLDKATDASDPAIDKYEEGMQKGEEQAEFGLQKYAEFTEGYEADVASKDPADYKKYRFESAIVEYEFQGSQEGTKTFYVNRGGYETAEYKIVKERKKEDRTAVILIGADMINIDFDSKSAIKMHNPAAYFLANPNRDWEETGENILIKLGYEKIGSEKISGKNCDIWKQGKHKIWVWDGLTLKSEHGRDIETAVNVKIDVKIPMEKFSVPEDFEYEIIGAKDMFPDLNDGEIENDEMSDEDYNKLLDEIETMSYADYKIKVLEEEPNADEEQIKQSYLILRQQARRREK